MIGNADCVDRERAQQYYKRCLKLHPNNFGCIIDYLKLLRDRYKFEEMMEVIDKGLEIADRRNNICKLKITKAFITWIRNPLKVDFPKKVAKELWLDVILNYPEECSKEIYVKRILLLFVFKIF